MVANFGEARIHYDTRAPSCGDSSPACNLRSHLRTPVILPSAGARSLQRRAVYAPECLCSAAIGE